MLFSCVVSLSFHSLSSLQKFRIHISPAHLGHLHELVLQFFKLLLTRTISLLFACLLHSCIYSLFLPSFMLQAVSVEFLVGRDEQTFYISLFKLEDLYQDHMYFVFRNLDRTVSNVCLSFRSFTSIHPCIAFISSSFLSCLLPHSFSY